MERMLFDSEQFNRIFPFYILIDDQLKIRSNGESLEKMYPAIQGKPFFQEFEINRPQLEKEDFTSMQSLVNQMVVLGFKQNKKVSKLRGQIEWLSDTNCMLFMGTPWFGSIEQVVENDLSIHDFAYHDPMIDLLHVLKTQEITTEDLKHLLNTVNKQKNELKKASKEIRDIALFSTQNPDPLVRIDFEGNILQKNPSADRLTDLQYNGKTYSQIDFLKHIAKNSIDSSKDRIILEASSANEVYSFMIKPLADYGYCNIYGRKITEQKKNQEQLKILSSIAEENTHGVVIADSEGRIEWVNSSFETMTGFKLEEIIGKKPGHFLQGPDTDPGMIEYLRSQIKKGEPFTCEILNYNKYKIPYWLRIQGQALKDEKGNVTKYFAIEQDITQERENLKKIREFEDRLRTALDQVGDYIWEHDFRTGKSRFSKEENHFLGISNINEVDIDKAWWEAIHKDDLPILEEGDRLYRNGEASEHSHEYRMVSKDGSIKWVLDRGVVIERDNEGRPLLIIGTHTDITRQKAIQHQIEESEKRYRDVIENSLALITTHDLDGKLLSANPIVEKIYGYQSDEIIGLSIEKLMPKEDQPLFTRKYLSRIKNKKEASGIFRVKSKDGRIVHTLYNNFLKEEPDREPYVIGFAVDITDRVKAERELRIAKKTTEELAAAKQNFLANMSHEIRTPMNAIMGMSSQLAKTNLSEQQMFYLKTIHTAADNLLVIINDILDLSKIDAGKLSIEEIGFEPKVVVGNALQVLMYKAEEKGISLTNSFCDSKLSDVIIGDPHRLNQILLNIISNAIKFTEEGSVDITCEVIEDMTDSQKVRVSVVDTGIGMEESFVKKLFKKFNQEYVSNSRKFGGTGLGMAITQQLVKLMGGEIKVKSKKGDGTTVSFEIPFNKGTEKDLPVEQTSNIHAAAIEGKKILVVDDNDMNRLVASAMLEHYQVEVMEAVNGKEAIRIIEEKKPDVVLMDLQMPVLNGLNATKKLRKAGNKVPIIALTANAIKGENEKCFAVGMDDYISKPYTEEELLQKLIRWTKSESISPTPKPNVSTAIETKVEEEVAVEDSKQTLYDLSGLEVISRGNKAFVQKMIDLFCKQTPLMLAEMNKAYDSGDLERVGALAHKMKPSIDNLKIVSIKQDIRTIEKAGKEGNKTDETKKLLQKVNTVVYQVIQSMESNKE